MVISPALRSRISFFGTLTARAAALGVLVAGFWFVVSMLRYQIAYFSPFPVADYWRTLHEILVGYHWPPPPAFYWLPHGDHRIPLPKLLIVLDLIIDRGSGVFLLAISYATQFLHACVIGFGLRRLSADSGGGRDRAWLWVTCLGGSLMALFHIVNWDNLIHPFQVCLILGYFLTTLAITWAAQKDFPVAGPIVAAILAPFCFLSALAVWPVMFATAAVVRRTWKPVLAILVSGAALYVVYFWGYQRLSPPIAISSLASQGHLAFFFGLIGRPVFPFTFFGPAGLGGSAGELGFAIFAAGVILLVLPLAPRLRSPVRIWISANIAFAFGSLLMISAGRWNQGYAWRYMTPAILLWIFVFAGIGYELSRFKLDAVFSGLVLMACVWNGTRLTFQNRIRWEVGGSTVDRARISSAAFAVGVEDPPVQVSIDSFGDLQRQVRRAVHERNLLIWPFAPFNKLGTVFPRPSRMCEGTVDAVRPLYSPNYPGFEIVGASRPRGDGRITEHQVYLLDEQDRVAGVSAESDSRLPEKWLAFLPATSAGKNITAVDTSADETPCLVTQPFKIEGNPLKQPVFYDSDRAGWTPIKASESGELKLPHTVSLDASGAGGKFNSVILHLRLPRENFVYLAVPGKPGKFAYAPPSNQWVYVVFHLNRGEEGVPETPLFGNSVTLIAYWPPVPGSGILDGAWITRDVAPRSDEDGLVYIDGTRQSK